MYKLFKRTLLLLFGFIGLISLPSCDTDMPTKYECLWQDSISAQFVNAKLNHPHYWCNPHYLEQFFTPPDSVLTQSLYNLFDSISNEVTETPLTLSWITSVYTKECYPHHPSATSYTKQLDLDNYHYSLLSNDLLEQVVIINQSHSINLNDYKHQLVIQLQNVPYPYDENILGTITWTYTWLGTNDSEYSNLLWTFYFPMNGITGVYVPNRGNIRYVYVNDHFEDI